MKFKDLEMGQQFRWIGTEGLCTKDGSTTYTLHSSGAFNHVSKEARNGGGRFDVIPEGEPPSMIAAAKRDARWYVLDNMDIDIDEVKPMRGCGIQEAIRIVKRRNLLNGLDVLKLELDAEGNDKTERVLHDLIEIVRELV